MTVKELKDLRQDLLHAYPQPKHEKCLANVLGLWHSIRCLEAEVAQLKAGARPRQGG